MKESVDEANRTGAAARAALSSSESSEVNWFHTPFSAKISLILRSTTFVKFSSTMSIARLSEKAAPSR